MIYLPEQIFQKTRPSITHICSSVSQTFELSDFSGDNNIPSYATRPTERPFAVIEVSLWVNYVSVK